MSLALGLIPVRVFPMTSYENAIWWATLSFGVVTEFWKGHERSTIFAECAACDSRSEHFFLVNISNGKQP